MYRPLLIAVLLCLLSCKGADIQTTPDETFQDSSEDIRARMVDPDATPETVELYRVLLGKTGPGSGLLFGHESSNMQGWSFAKFSPEKIQSDILTSTGDLPAVFGYDFNRGYAALLPIAKQAAEAGGIITISNHMKFPGMDSYHYSNIRDQVKDPVSAVMPGGDYHQGFLEELDKIAEFAGNLTVGGRPVPILFRPWHEHTGKWFWWGAGACTEAQFSELWHFTVRYLRDEKEVHNLIYVFSPSRPGEHGGYSYRNPGDSWFDIAGFDCYHTSEEGGPQEFMVNATVTAGYAQEHGKIAAIAEFGYKKGITRCSYPEWYSRKFLAPLEEAGLVSTFAYCMTWQDGDDSRWIPRKGDLQFEDFLRFHDNDEVHFLSEIPVPDHR